MKFCVVDTTAIRILAIQFLSFLFCQCFVKFFDTSHLCEEDAIT